MIHFFKSGSRSPKTNPLKTMRNPDNKKTAAVILLQFIKKYMAFVEATEEEQKAIIYHEEISQRDADYLWDCWQYNSFAGFFLHLDRKNTQHFLKALGVDGKNTRLYDKFITFAANTCPSSIVDPLPKIKGFKDYGSAENWGRLLVWYENEWIVNCKKDSIKNLFSLEKGTFN